MAKRAQRSGNLPAEVASFVGRRHEMAEARKKLAAVRLMSLVGPGGVGKTRLAVRIATDVGLGSEQNLRRVLQRQFGIGPADYRARFSGRRGDGITVEIRPSL